MLATKPNSWDIQSVFTKNDRYMILDFQENADGKFVAGFKKPRDFIDGYCQMTNTKSPMNIIGIQDRHTYEWIYTPVAKEFFNVQIEQFDDAVLVYIDKNPLGYWEFWYRFGTEQELYEGDDDVGY